MILSLPFKWWVFINWEFTKIINEKFDHYWFINQNIQIWNNLQLKNYNLKWQNKKIYPNNYFVMCHKHYIKYFNNFLNDNNLYHDFYINNIFCGNFVKNISWFGYVLKNTSNNIIEIPWELLINDYSFNINLNYNESNLTSYYEKKDYIYYVTNNNLWLFNLLNINFWKKSNYIENWYVIYENEYDSFGNYFCPKMIKFGKNIILWMIETKTIWTDIEYCYYYNWLYLLIHKTEWNIEIKKLYECDINNKMPSSCFCVVDKDIIIIEHDFIFEQIEDNGVLKYKCLWELKIKNFNLNITTTYTHNNF
jgi:hypothetical protein